MFKNKLIRNIVIISILFFIYVFISAKSYSNAIFQDLSNNVLRLHVVANSDSKEDQELKYKVRDSVLDYMKQLSSNCKTKEEAINVLSTHLDEFHEIAKSTIKDNGFDYDVNISISKFEFPTKYYGDISLPAGFYDALKIEIGSSAGQNWWCVMFPPLCFVDISTGVVPDESKELLKNNLTDEEYRIVSDSSSDVKIKFKFLEMFKK